MLAWVTNMSTSPDLNIEFSTGSAGAGGHEVLVNCTCVYDVHSKKFLDVQMCLRNSPPYFRTSASPVSMQKVLYLNSDKVEIV